MTMIHNSFLRPTTLYNIASHTRRLTIDCYNHSLTLKRLYSFRKNLLTYYVSRKIETFYYNASVCHSELFLKCCFKGFLYRS